MSVLQQYSNRIIAGFSIVVLCVAGLLWALRPYGFLSVNWTKSLPGLLFWVDTTTTPELGDIAAFYPPKGHKLHDNMWFGKIVVGQAGDTIRIEDSHIVLNDTSIGVILPYTIHGEVLEPIHPGVIPEQHVFVWTPHERSYDSRYKDIGLIHEDAIFGRLVRLL